MTRTVRDVVVDTNGGKVQGPSTPGTARGAATLMAANEAVCLYWLETGATGDLPALFVEARPALGKDLAKLHARRKRKPRARAV